MTSVRPNSMQLSKMHIAISALCFFTLTCDLTAFAQDGAIQEAPLSFEVATIRPSKDVTEQESINVYPGGRFQATLTLRSLIERAYGVRDFQLAGGPNWLSQKYEIVAKADEPADPEKLAPDEGDRLFQREMQRMQTLLADRFQFRFHRETKQELVYALVARGGPRLNAPKAGESHRLYSQRPGELACYGASMAEFADELNEIIVGRKVVDQSGLGGRFDFYLKWTPDALLEEKAGADSTGPSLFSALEEQLGLRLRSAKGAVDLLVIDKLEKPSEN